MAQVVVDSVVFVPRVVGVADGVPVGSSVPLTGQLWPRGDMTVAS